MKRVRRSKLNLKQGLLERIKPNQSYYGSWSGVDVRWKTPSGVFIATSKYPIGGWNIPCRICLTAKGLIVYAFETESEQM